MFVQAQQCTKLLRLHTSLAPHLPLCLLLLCVARCKVLTQRQLDLLNSIDFDWTGADPLS
jgi:hypothetical protein